MKRDMDIVRKILLAIEAEKNGYAPNEFNIDGYDNEMIGYHILIMVEAGLIEGIINREVGHPTPTAWATRLKWAGHEFLDAARESSRWEKAKSVAIKTGGVTLDVLTEILKKLITDEVKAYL